jgi:transcriptional regulator with XRE-family HTH domain
MAKYLKLDEVASELAKQFGRNVKARRIEMKLSQGELHEITGVTPSYISFIENGRANPSLDVMEALAAALGVSVADMLAKNDKAQKKKSGYMHSEVGNR